MHPNPAFRQTEQATAIAMARNRAFGTLLLNGEQTPLIAHIPFLLNEAGTEAELHLVRSNPIARRVKDATPATLAVTGPDAYISPDWYGAEDQVPTWNYAAVHLTGSLTPLPTTNLLPLLDRLSHHFESQLAPKPEWLTTKMTPEVLQKMLRQILPYRLKVTDIQSTFKLGQNKPDSARTKAATELKQSPIGQNTAALAALMQNPPD
ncbi:FMN-binding negative transcriptional regulator [Alphaproteobacteria bacterium KMM 3653]|uniref:FMN-binding negative transcriptional regulator n=1 Tax=Harenicola maris TaxID=2841044 RepID=A0AAP2CQX4_9RHOB|nr:FMN-binding negative transcriptional regulator [Harenicola maris]